MAPASKYTLRGRQKVCQWHDVPDHPDQAVADWMVHMHGQEWQIRDDNMPPSYQKAAKTLHKVLSSTKANIRHALAHLKDHQYGLHEAAIAAWFGWIPRKKDDDQDPDDFGLKGITFPSTKVKSKPSAENLARFPVLSEKELARGLYLSDMGPSAYLPKVAFVPFHDRWGISVLENNITVLKARIAKGDDSPEVMEANQLALAEFEAGRWPHNWGQGANHIITSGASFPYLAAPNPGAPINGYFNPGDHVCTVGIHVDGYTKLASHLGWVQDDRLMQA